MSAPVDAARQHLLPAGTISAGGGSRVNRSAISTGTTGGRTTIFHTRSTTTPDAMFLLAASAQADTALSQRGLTLTGSKSSSTLTAWHGSERMAPYRAIPSSTTGAGISRA